MFNSESEKIRAIIEAVHAGYQNGDNLMEIARNKLSKTTNDSVATLLSYDLRAGDSQIINAEQEKERLKWCRQAAEYIKPHLPNQGSIIEVGSGEARTLSGVISNLSELIGAAFGFDISWSRVNSGMKRLRKESLSAKQFVGDIFHIPLDDCSVDIVYSSHSLEPNGGSEEPALKECLRVARHAVILIEPIYELAKPVQQRWMDNHGYIKGLKKTAEKLEALISEYKMLDFSLRPENASGILIINKTPTQKTPDDNNIKWQCPLTGTPMIDLGDVFCNTKLGIVYPVIRGIPMLRPEHAIVATKLYREV